jgi:hypothetical protein
VRNTGEEAINRDKGLLLTTCFSFKTLSGCFIFFLGNVEKKRTAWNEASKKAFDELFAEYIREDRGYPGLYFFRY